MEKRFLFRRFEEKRPRDFFHFTRCRRFFSFDGNNNHHSFKVRAILTFSGLFRVFLPRLPLPRTTIIAVVEIEDQEHRGGQRQQPQLGPDPPACPVGRRRCSPHIVRHSPEKVGQPGEEQVVLVPLRGQAHLSGLDVLGVQPSAGQNGGKDGGVRLRVSPGPPFVQGQTGDVEVGRRRRIDITAAF